MSIGEECTNARLWIVEDGLEEERVRLYGVHRLGMGVLDLFSCLILLMKLCLKMHSATAAARCSTSNQIENVQSGLQCLFRCI